MTIEELNKLHEEVINIFNLLNTKLLKYKREATEAIQGDISKEYIAKLMFEVAAESERVNGKKGPAKEMESLALDIAMNALKDEDLGSKITYAGRSMKREEGMSKSKLDYDNFMETLEKKKAQGLIDQDGIDVIKSKFEPVITQKELEKALDAYDLPIKVKAFYKSMPNGKIKLKMLS